jgi:hypothetical protein
VNIVQAIKDENLFLPYLRGKDKDLSSWHNWMICLRCIYGLPVRQPKNRELIRRCTGRNPDALPKDGFNTVLLLCGRRSGKSKVAGLLAAYEASLSGRESVCSPGELPMVSIISPTRDQSKIIKSYTRAALGAPLLTEEVGDATREGFPLRNGVNVRILTGQFNIVRGYSQICVVCDEVCFLGTSEESKLKSDTELIRSVRPSLLTTGGRLIAVSTKFAPRGWAYSTSKRHFGNDASRVLVWDADSRTMNPTLNQADIDEAVAEDPASARAEFLNCWREDIQSYLPREAIEPCVIPGRKELLPRQNIRYTAFADLSGGRSDSAALAIGHREAGKIVLDFLKEYKAPFSPYDVAGKMSRELERYGLRLVTGDHFSAEFAVQAFRGNGIRYMASEKNKSELYLELLPAICSRQIELLDDERLITQLASLERKTRSGGRDSVDHPSGQRDDLANTVAGLAAITSKPIIRCGGWGANDANRHGTILRL